MSIEQRLSEINWSQLTTGRTYHPSPASWDDEILYFLLLDRFSDGKEYGGFKDAAGTPVAGPAGGRSTPLFNRATHAGTAAWNDWFSAGQRWCGGTLAGLKDKLGYLQRLGVTAVWLSPVFRQVTDSQDYHGYGIQNFLDVDPHFGTREELRELVEGAHAQGLRVILDIIFNHAGDVFAYPHNAAYQYCHGQQFPVQGFRSAAGDPGSLPFGPVDLAAHPKAWPGQAVWPAEFQIQEAWTRHGAIQNWDSFPQYLDGDFCSLKDLHHGDGLRDAGLEWDLLRRIQAFRLAPTLVHLAEVFKFWIAYADVDGFRVDTVKHLEPGAMRYFANVLNEFTKSLGKENFYLIGEVTGGRERAVNMVNYAGLNAALGIDDIQDKLEYLAKGWRNPGNPTTPEQEGYFDLFRNSLDEGKATHQWFGRHVVTMFDDHDQVVAARKYRFCGEHPDSEACLDVALAINLTSMGIPCIYYGTEQAFNGADPRAGQDHDYGDVFLRECMFGGPFGSFQSTNAHFFDEQSPHYQRIAELCALRRQHLALRRGRQYLRELSEDGVSFFYPEMVAGALRFVVAWSRLFNNEELLCAVNTDVTASKTVWATVDAHLHHPGSSMHCLYSTNPAQVGSAATVAARNGSAISITVPPGGFVLYR
ncbi:alpha-amylase family glycosyl hydrolase [Megalodesulfovibrio paquesii]